MVLLCIRGLRCVFTIHFDVDWIHSKAEDILGKVKERLYFVLA